MMNIIINKLISDATTTSFNEDGAGFHRFCKETFAELIIKECVKLMDETVVKAADNNTYMGEDVPTMVHQSNIKKHFGIE
jgi:hypothetical protein